MACRQDEPCQGRQQRIHPVNGILKSPDLLVVDGFERIRQRRSGGCYKVTPDMKESGLDLLDLSIYIGIFIAQRSAQGSENRIKLVHITASFQPLVRLAHPLAAEKACLAVIACACVDFDGPPPSFCISLGTNESPGSGREV